MPNIACIRPTDQPIDRSAAADFTKMIGDLCVRVANRDVRPQWKDGSFFKRFAKPVTTETTVERPDVR